MKMNTCISDVIWDRCSHYFSSSRFTKMCNVFICIVFWKESERETVTVNVRERTLSALLDAKVSVSSTIFVLQRANNMRWKDIIYHQHFQISYEKDWLIQSTHMIKAKSSLMIVKMKSKLRYKVDFLTYFKENVKRFYFNLRLISNSIYERTKEEFEVYERKKYHKDYITIFEKVLSKLSVVQVSRSRL